MSIRRKRNEHVFKPGKIPPDQYVIIIADGRDFGSLISGSFRKPFDYEFHFLMVDTANAVMESKSGEEILLAYVKSDEIYFLFNPGTKLLRRDSAAISSSVSGSVSAIFTNKLIQKGKDGFGAFRTEILTAPSLDEVVSIYTEAQKDAYVNAVNTYVAKKENVLCSKGFEKNLISDILFDFLASMPLGNEKLIYGSLAHREEVRQKYKVIYTSGEGASHSSVSVKRPIRISPIGLFSKRNPELRKIIFYAFTEKMRKYYQGRPQMNYSPGAV